MPKLNSHLPPLLNLSELIPLITKGKRINEVNIWGKEAKVLFLRIPSFKRGPNNPGQSKTWWKKELKPRLGFLFRPLPLFWMELPFSLMHPSGIPSKRRWGML